MALPHLDPRSVYTAPVALIPAGLRVQPIKILGHPPQNLVNRLPDPVQDPAAPVLPEKRG